MEAGTLEFGCKVNGKRHDFKVITTIPGKFAKSLSDVWMRTAKKLTLEKFIKFANKAYPNCITETEEDFHRTAVSIDAILEVINNSVENSNQ